MARDFERDYDDYRRRDYDRDNYRNWGRSSDRDTGRESYSGGRYFYEGRTYASDRNRPGEYDRGYDRGDAYADFTDRNYGTDYRRSRSSEYDRDYGYGRGYGSEPEYGYGRADYDRDFDPNRYGYSRDYDRSRDWDYDRSRDYERGSRRRWDDAWNGYGYGPEDERRMMRGGYDDAYSRGDYNRGEFDRTPGSYMGRSDTWDRDYDRNRGEWQTGDRSWTRDYDRDRSEDWERQYDRNWGNSSFSPNWRRRREMETH